MDGDPIARLIAEEDQALMAVRALASRITEYRARLIIGGLSPEEAWELVNEYHAVLLAHSFASPGEGS